MSVPQDPAASRWHLDKRIPIALIMTIVLQTGAAIWWAATVSSFNAQIETRVVNIEKFIAQGDRFTQEDARQRINPLEQNIAVIKNDIQQIKEILQEQRRGN